jgi:hypothetical protein
VHAAQRGPLVPLAFVSPRIVSALLDGTAPADLTVTTLARGLPYSWAEQERRVGPSIKRQTRTHVEKGDSHSRSGVRQLRRTAWARAATGR